MKTFISPRGHTLPDNRSAERRISPAIGEFAIQDAARLRALNAELVAVLETTIAPLILLGDFIGNEHAGNVSAAPFDRCAIISGIRALLARLGEQS